MSAPARRLQTARGPLALGGRVWLMGIVNATPDSFSDTAEERTLDGRLARARELVAAGADVLDIGGESGITDGRPITPEEEIARITPVIERVTAELDVLVSVDTYKPAVARAAIAAGAAIVNDVSGLRDPALADVCADTGAGLVLMHTRAQPKQRLHDPALDRTIVGDVRTFLEERIALAVSRGMSPEQLMLDPGPDFSKTPYQSVGVVRELAALHELERPLLLAISRKDFIGAITERRPRERLAGTLAALGFGADAGGHMVRIHDVAAAADYLAVRDVLRGERDVAPDLRLAEGLRREPAAGHSSS